MLEMYLHRLLLTAVLYVGCSAISGLDHIRYFEPVHFDVNQLRHLHHVTKRSTSQPIRFEFSAFGRKFPIHLEPDKSVHHPSMIVETGQGRQLYDSSRFYRGHVVDEPSSIHGLITKGGHFEGTIYLPTETYFIERTHHHIDEMPEFHNVIYRLSDVIFNTSSPTCAHEMLRRKQQEMTSTYLNDPGTRAHVETEWKNKYIEEMNDRRDDIESNKHGRQKRAIDPTKVTCELYMQADHLYYEKYGSDVDRVIDKLTQYVSAVTDIYKTVDFDGDGSADNIGFVIKKIKIYTDPAAEGYKYPGNYAVDYLLDRHSQDNYDDYCLSYLFTERDFDGGVLGLAWIGELSSLGGVCQKQATLQGVAKSLNTGLVTELNYGTSVPSVVTIVTFAHEIGHNFGSPHDVETDSTCTPGGDAGNYIMYARATSGMKTNNNQLSSCSIALIKIILENKARNGDGCFVPFRDEVCGNRVVEGDEDCDCGWEAECTEGCCNPQVMDPSAPGVETPCTRKSTAACSPSQGACCTSSCQYAANTVTCREASSCLDSATCNHECPASGLRANRTECGDENDFQVCLNGECTGSICLAYGRDTCQCEPEVAGNWADVTLCQVCCMDAGQCKSSFNLSDIPDKDVASGTPCFNFQGYCDVFKKCRHVDPSGPLSSLRNLLTSGGALGSMKEYLTKHWYIGVAGGVGLVIIIVLVVKFCSKSRKKEDDKSQQVRSRPRHIDTSQPRYSFETNKPRTNRVEPYEWM